MDEAPPGWTRTGVNRITHNDNYHLSIVYVEPYYMVSVYDSLYQYPFIRLTDALDYAHHLVLPQRTVRRSYDESHTRTQVRGGREGLKKHIFYPTPLDRQEWSNQAHPTQAQGTREWIMTHARDGKQLEQQIAEAIQRYVDQSEFKFQFKVPTYIDPLLAVGMPKKAAEILVDRAGGAIFISAEVGPVQQFSEIDTLLARLISILGEAPKLPLRAGITPDPLDKAGYIGELEIGKINKTLNLTRIEEFNRKKNEWQLVVIRDPETNAIRLADAFTIKKLLEYGLEMQRRLNLVREFALEPRNREIVTWNFKVYMTEYNRNNPSLMVKLKKLAKERRMSIPELHRTIVRLNQPGFNAMDEMMWSNLYIVNWFFDLIEKQIVDPENGERQPVRLTFSRIGAPPTVVEIDFSQPVPHLQHSNAKETHASVHGLDYRTFNEVTLQQLPPLLARLARRKKRKGRVLPPF